MHETHTHTQRERERERERERGRDTGGGRSRLHAGSPTAGLDPETPGSRPGPKAGRCQTAEPPRDPLTLHFKKNLFS